MVYWRWVCVPLISTQQAIFHGSAMLGGAPVFIGVQLQLLVEQSKVYSMTAYNF